METDFQKHYDTLDLDSSVDWITVQATYRKMVNQWHPDRPHNSKRRQSAEDRFIELTKAYNALRDYDRKNKRLPVFKRTYQYSEPENAGAVNLDDRAASGWSDSGRKTRKRPQKDNSLLKVIGVATVAMTLLAVGLGVLFVLDHRSKLQATERAKVLVNTVEPSPFVTSPDKLRRAESKGAFIHADPLSRPLANQSKTGVLID